MTMLSDIPTPGQVISDRAAYFEEVAIITKMGRTAIFEAVKKRGFPQPIRLHKTRNAWMLSEVYAWLRGLPRAGEVDGAPERAARRMREAKRAKSEAALGDMNRDARAAKVA